MCDVKVKTCQLLDTTTEEETCLFIDDEGNIHESFTSKKEIMCEINKKGISNLSVKEILNIIESAPEYKIQPK